MTTPVGNELTVSAEAPRIAPNIAPTERESFSEHLQDLWHFRYLLRNLIVRNLKIRYKNSVLGVVWSLLNPLLMMTVFTIVFSVFSNSNIEPYPVFILLGILPWNFHTGSVIGGAHSVLTNGSLVKKVYFPRIILPTSLVMSNLVNFAIAFSVLIIMLYAYGIGLTRHALWVPIILVTQLLFLLGLVYFLSALQVFFRDIAMILDVGVLAWMFLTPVFYPLEQFADASVTLFGNIIEVPRLMRWVNPMAAIIDGYRTVLWGVYGSSPGVPASMGVDFIARTFVTSLIIFIFGYWFFRRTEHLFGEKI